MSTSPSTNRHFDSCRKWWGMFGIGLGTLMFTLDTSVVNIALPTLIKAFNTNFATTELLVTSYLLVITSLLLGAARLGDIWDKKRLYLSGLTIFTIGSLLCGLSSSIHFLIGFRVVQGLGAVFMAALNFAIVTEIFPDRQRGKALGFLGTTVSIGVALGPTIGGYLIDALSWRAIFFINVPVGLVAGYIVTRFVPKLTKSCDSRSKFDVVGTLILIVTLAAFTIGMNQGQERAWNSRIVVICGAIALCGLIGFILAETRIKQPILNLSLLHNFQLSLALLTKLIVFVVLAGVVFILPFLIEKVMQYSTGQTGLLMASEPLLGAIFAPIAGSLSDRFGSRIISLCGLILMATGCYCLSTFDAQLTDLGYIARIAPFGIGLGIFQAPNNSTIMGEAPQNKMGVASGLLALSRSVGQTMGVPIMGSLLVAFTIGSSSGSNQGSAIASASTEALIGGVKSTFLVATAIMSLNVVAALIELWQYRHEETMRLGD